MTERDIPVLNRTTLEHYLRTSNAWQSYVQNGVITVGQIVDIVMRLHQDAGIVTHDSRYK